MSLTIPYLFVYGTLRRGTGHPMADFLQRHGRYVCSAQAPGRIYDLGSYPGMVEATEPHDHVRGDLFEVTDPDLVLAELDRYEACGPDDPQPHLFQRSVRMVRTATGAEVQAWMYQYFGPVREEQRIASGEYYRDDLKGFDWRRTLP
jgi:gamma-glutamylcyclotransferase (GGCT)/AIG2-like uncharacterized protein YtfP